VPNTVVFLWTTASALRGLPGVAGLELDLPGVAVHSPGSGSAVDGVPARALADLRDFGAVSGVSFVAVSQRRPLGLPAYDAARVDALESELEQARTALAALEEPSASARLHKVEAELLAHPHLPQASFLMAECLALQAQAARSQSAERAAELDQKRAAIEGARAAAFGEAASTGASAPQVTLEVTGVGAGDELEIDGARRPRGTSKLTLAPGLHHARVWRGNRPVFAEFATVTAGQTAFKLEVPQRSACSAEDLEQVPRSAESSNASLPAALPSDIACGQWAQVREESGGIGVALCEKSRCGAFMHWQRHAPARFAPIATASRRFPTWAGVVIAGGAALVASSVVLWQSGAFERGRPAAATWEYGGLNTQGLRF
jgi:hypothetical protein